MDNKSRGEGLRMKSNVNPELRAGTALRGFACLALFGALSVEARAADPAGPVQVAQAAPSGENAAASDNGGLSEIVVTARRRSEKLQKTPVAVTAFSPA